MCRSPTYLIFVYFMRSLKASRIVIPRAKVEQDSVSEFLKLLCGLLAAIGRTMVAISIVIWTLKFADSDT